MVLAHFYTQKFCLNKICLDISAVLPATATAVNTFWKRHKEEYILPVVLLLRGRIRIRKGELRRERDYGLYIVGSMYIVAVACVLHKTTAVV